MKELSRNASGLAVSSTVAITTKAAELRAAGRDVISLSVGEPDFDTPDHIRQAGIDAINAGRTRYTAATGLPELKRAVCDDFERTWGLRYGPTQIAVTNGGKHAVAQAVLALCDPGDEVIIPAPYWVTYPEVIKLAGARAVVVPATAASGFRISPEQLRAAVTPKTKLLIFNSPSNPTGAVYPPDEVAALAAVAREHDLYVVTDEIYARLLFPGSVHASMAACDGMRERTLVVNGGSKAYAMTGWRIGWMAAPEHVAPVVNRIQGQLTHHPCTVTQYAALAALTGPHGFLEGWVRSFEERMRYVAERLDGMPGITCYRPQGAFYVFPDMRGIIGKTLGGKEIIDDVALCTALLDDADIALVPGTAFGAPGHVRICYASSMETLERAMDRLEKSVKRMVPEKSVGGQA